MKVLMKNTICRTLSESLSAYRLTVGSPNRIHHIRCLSAKSSNNTLTNQRVAAENTKRIAETVRVWPQMTIPDLARALGRPQQYVKEAIRTLDISHLDQNGVVKVVKFFEQKPLLIPKPGSVSVDLLEKEFDFEEEVRKLVTKGSKMASRVPVVTIMGHVDHGKTTLLDGLRKSELVKQEFGGITQHIGAFVVSLGEQSKPQRKDLVTFLDTPGHKAFSAMRERGANITDIVVLVVAIDDGVMEQTRESISFATSSNVPIIVAINKVDKSTNFEKDLEHLKMGLRAHGIVLEEEGGDVQSVQMSALKGTGLDQLKEAILALAETLELNAYVDGSVNAVVLESSVDPKKGKKASILVREGTLKKGDLIIAGEKSWAKVRAMYDEWGNVVDKCGPGFPVQVIGWRDDHLPDAGDNVWQLDNEKRAKDLIQSAKSVQRRKRAEFDSIAAQVKLEEHLKVYKEELAALRAAGIRYKRKKNKGPREKMIKEEDTSHKLHAIAKCDVTGSLEVLLNIFESYPNDRSEAKLDLLHYGIGSVTEKEVELAACFDRTVIYAFNVGTASPQITKLAKDYGVTIKRFNVIYHLVDDLKNEISDRLPLLDKEEVLGEALVLQEFMVNESNKKIPVAGARCVKGTLKKSNCLYKVIRREAEVANSLAIASMRHLKDEVDTIKKDFECGLRFKGVVGADGLRFEPNDTIVCYETKKVKQKTNWIPKGFD